MATSTNIVAGKNAGIKVGISPALKPVYDQLKQLGLRGNHWARVATQEIDSLTSGNMKPNVLVGQSCNLLNNFVFTLILPGCKASVRKTSSGEYFVYHLELDVGFEELVQRGKRPALYCARPGDDEWILQESRDGTIKKMDSRVVVVSDGYETPAQAARQAAVHAGDAPIGGGSYMVDRHGFDMQYHHGRSIGGFLQITEARNPEGSMELRENAVLLAGTMEKAKRVPGVAWIAERGGVGVLTHALQILKERGVKFDADKEHKHYVYFSHPTTSLTKAENLARELGFEFARSSHTSDKLNLDELVGGLNFGGDIIGAYQRFRCDESYSAVHMGVDMAKASGGSWQAVTTIAASSAAVSAAIGLGGGSVALPATIALASAVGGLGKTLFKAWLPRRYRSIVSKL